MSLEAARRKSNPSIMRRTFRPGPIESTTPRTTFSSFKADSDGLDPSAAPSPRNPRSPSIKNQVPSNSARFRSTPCDRGIQLLVLDFQHRIRTSLAKASFQKLASLRKLTRITATLPFCSLAGPDEFGFTAMWGGRHNALYMNWIMSQLAGL